MKKLALGFALGALIAFHLGINYGRDRPLLSNPYAPYGMADMLKDQAKKVLESTKESIHDATDPRRK